MILIKHLTYSHVKLKNLGKKSFSGYPWVCEKSFESPSLPEMLEFQTLSSYRFKKIRNNLKPAPVYSWNLKLFSFHPLEEWTGKEHQGGSGTGRDGLGRCGRAGPGCVGSSRILIIWSKVNIFHSTPHAPKINSFRKIMLLRIS